jgi:trehalose-phosphatase
VTRARRAIKGAAVLPPDAAARRVRAAAGTRGLALFLDFDGTLAPIVDRPEDARLAPEVAASLVALAARGPVAIVTGRALDDVRGRVPPGLLLAGGHGYEIDAPGVPPAPVAAEAIVRRVAAAARRLETALAGCEGVRVEPKRFAAAVHWRHADPAAVPVIGLRVAEVAAALDGLVVTQGKAVFELRPAEAWDKGRAVQWIRAALDLGPATHLAVFAGDDTTDLDGLAAVRGDGLGIVVGDAIPAAAGELRLADPAAVAAFLAALTGR